MISYKCSKVNILLLQLVKFRMLDVIHIITIDCKILVVNLNLNKNHNLNGIYLSKYRVRLFEWSFLSLAVLSREGWFRKFTL